jgi:hypothetical protein
MSTGTQDLAEARAARLQAEHLMREARAWVADCEWGEDAATLAALPDAAVRRGVDRHYAGGWEAFARDCG